MHDCTQLVDTAPEKVRIRVIGWDGDAKYVRPATLIRFGEKWWAPIQGHYIRWMPIFWKPLPAKKMRST